MVSISVVIPTYKAQEYICACLDSLEVQGLSSWEAVVVVDGSPDDSAQVAREYVRKDARIRVVDVPQNRGLHLTRMRGVQESCGEYVVFLDPDDTLAPGFLGKLWDAITQAGKPDVMHYGIRLIAEDPGFEDLVAQFEEQSNRPFGELVGEQALLPAFERAGNYQRDFRVTQRAFRRELIAGAFNKMSQERLEGAEDSYEYLVIASQLGRECTRNDLVGYMYHMGRGFTSSRPLTVGEFQKILRSYQACVDAVRAYAARDGRACVARACDGLAYKLYETMGTYWNTRIADDDLAQAAHVFAQVCGVPAAAAQVARAGRDVAWKVYKGEAGKAAYHRAKRLERLDRELVGDEKIPATHEYWEFESAFASHMADIRHARERKRPTYVLRCGARKLKGVVRRVYRGIRRRL